MDPVLFVPDRPGGSLKRVYAICNGDGQRGPCPVRAECNQFAIDNELVGVFGGVNHSQRRPAREIAVQVVVAIQDGRPKRS